MQVTPKSVVRSGLKIHLKMKALLWPHFSGPQGRETPWFKVGSGPDSICSEIVCFSGLPANLMKIRLKMKAIPCPQNKFHYKSMGKNSTLEANCPIWLAIELIRDCMPVLVTASLMKIQSYNEGAIVSTTFFTGAQGRVTLKISVESGGSSNSSEILYPSQLPASLKKVRSKMKALSCPQHFPHYKSMRFWLPCKPEY